MGKDKKLIVESCEYCKNYIQTKEDNYVCVSTFNRVTKPNHHAYFHFKCWNDYINDSVGRKAKEMVDKSRQHIASILQNPIIKDALREVPNFSNVLSMLNMPLTDAQKVKAQIDNGRTKGNNKGANKTLQKKNIAPKQKKV